MRPGPEESLIQNLEGKWPEGSLYFMPKERALEELKKITGVDHGYDVNAWRDWLKPETQGFSEETTRKWLIAERPAAEGGFEAQVRQGHWASCGAR